MFRDDRIAGAPTSGPSETSISGGQSERSLPRRPPFEQESPHTPEGELRAIDRRRDGVVTSRPSCCPSAGLEASHSGPKVEEDHPREEWELRVQVPEDEGLSKT